MLVTHQCRIKYADYQINLVDKNNDILISYLVKLCYSI